MKLPIYSIYIWSWRRDSNPWPADYETATLPTELLQHMLRRNNHISPLSSSHRLSDRQGLSCGANRIGRYYPWRFFIWHWSTYVIRPVPWRSASKVHWRDGAGGRIRTVNRLITNQLLYQLSYTSIYLRLFAVLVDRQGFEPWTNRLWADCSANWANGPCVTDKRFVLVRCNKKRNVKNEWFL